jgi:hypothetical protein
MKALLLFAAVVFTVNIVEALPPPEIETLFGSRLQVGRFCAPVGDATSAQPKLTVPEYALPAEKATVAEAIPPAVTGAGLDTAITRGATVMVDVPEAGA